MHDTVLDGQIAKAIAAAQPPVGVGLAARRRSAGRLSPDEIAFCRRQGIALSFDPVQIGWVTADCLDDLDEWDQAGPVTVGKSAIPRTESAFQPRSLAPIYRFRAWTEEDLPIYRALLDDAAVWAMMYETYPDPLDDDLARDLIALSAASGHHEVRAVLCNGEIVGQVRMLFDIGDAPKSAEFSYWLGRAHWGKGIGAAIVAIHSGQTFVCHPTLASIYAVVHPGNAASRQILRKAGFAEEGPAQSRPGWISYRLTRSVAEAINSGSDRP